jgi:transposase
MKVSQSRTLLKVSSSAVAKNIKRYDETGSHEDHHRKARPRVTAAKDKLTTTQIAAQINASQSSSNRHISKSTVQKRLHKSDLHGRIGPTKPLLKDTNKKKRLALC